MAPEPDFLAIQTQTGWGQTLQRFADWCAASPGDRCLDVGCGPGLLPRLLAERGCQAYGADLNGFALGEQRLHPHLSRADALELPFPAGAFELVTASNLLFLLPDPLAALREMRRVLASHGQLCLLNPSEQMSLAAAQALVEQRGLDGAARQSLLNWAQRAEQHARWDAAQTGELLQAAGLRLVESALKIGAGLARFSRARQ